MGPWTLPRAWSARVCIHCGLSHRVWELLVTEPQGQAARGAAEFAVRSGFNRGGKPGLRDLRWFPRSHTAGPRLELDLPDPKAPAVLLPLHSVAPGDLEPLAGVPLPLIASSGGKLQPDDGKLPRSL